MVFVVMVVGFVFGGGRGGVRSGGDGAGLFDEEGDGVADFGERGGFLGGLGTAGGGWWTHVAFVWERILERTLSLAEGGIW